MSRTKNSVKNLIAGIGSEVLITLIKFVTRTIFIQTLGAKYLGISGLFTNILTVLSLAELGIGTAITYSLYKPIANKDEHQIILLMKLYKNAFRLIGIAIAIIGLLLIPFLPIIIKDEINFVNLNFIFLLYLMQTVSSYLFFAYKSVIIKANQKERVITSIGLVYFVITNIIQIIILVVYSNFEVFVMISVISNVLQNITIAVKANKMFPYINKKTKDNLPKSEKINIFKNIYANFIYKINAVILNSTDSILLATFIGLEIVGIYSNYLLIVSTVKTILNKFYSAIISSLGDLHASENRKQEYAIFKIVNFFTFFVSGLAAIATFVVGNMFIKFWVGSEFVLSDLFVLLIAIEIYIFGIQRNLSIFRSAMGLFQQAKYRPILGIFINLSVSLILLNQIGIYGVVIGTIISILVTFLSFDPYIIYKYVFKKPTLDYYLINMRYFLTICIAGAISFYISKLINGEGIFYIVIYSLICIVVLSTFTYVFYRKTLEFRYLVNFIKKIYVSVK
jgi:O-antigen/teichoic acid export membrane protein